ncbi:hypothetical protein Q673_02605 [Marinobacter sp. EN3]|uniref:hypothetical protein n=1 Tax=Marinobacter sp. EN3 TaxID=1397533 RepID=UPI0003B8F2D7|nr:hypothetical protein [Marinobacter sp. EN3]ERS12525.1 hypothetical protein Q673_02605 [Marinobacter sp. EN3]
MAVNENSTVRWFHSDMPGAPQFDATPGELIRILDACLIDGFGTKSPDGNKITISNGVATVEFSSGHGFEKHTVIEIEGATPANLSDVWRVTSTTATTFTFDCPGIPDGNATGSITVKMATPGYWEKTFDDGVSTAAFRSIHPDSSGCFLKIEDSDTGSDAHTVVQGYKTMSDLNTGTSPFPAETDYCGWMKYEFLSQITNGRLKWFVACDERFFMLLITNTGTDDTFYYATPYLFGDLRNTAITDQFPCVLTGHERSFADSPTDYYSINRIENANSTQGLNIADNAAGLSGAQQWLLAGHSIADGSSWGQGDDYPSTISNGYVFADVIFVLSSVSGPIRGMLPGIMQSLVASDQVIGEPNGKGLAMVVVEPSHTYSKPIMAVGWVRICVGIDLWGPWR